MKKEELYRANYKSERELKKSVSKYIEFYNEDALILRYRINL